MNRFMEHVLDELHRAGFAIGSSELRELVSVIVSVCEDDKAGLLQERNARISSLEKELEEFREKAWMYDQLCK